MNRARLPRRIAPLALALVLLVSVTTPGVRAATDDDGNYEVGAQSIENYSSPYSPLDYCNEDAQSLMDWLVNPGGWDQVMDEENSAAYEDHAKSTGSGGNDNSYADAVDLFYFSGHGETSHVIYSDTAHDDQWLSCTTVAWGDVDAEWVMLSACLTLNAANRGDWAWYALNGLHLLCGAATTLDDADHGDHVGNLMVDNGWWDTACTVKASWFNGMEYHNSEGTVLVVIGETTDCGDDYIWGQGDGPVDDPTVDHSYTEWTWEV